jgi:cytochrome P450
MNSSRLETALPSSAVAAPPSEAPAGVPVSDVDPFSIEFFEDPHRIHDELREAGPVVWLSRHGIFAVARYREVYDVLHDWQTFCSSRGVGLSDFAKEKPWRPPSLVLETDPPEHDRARAVLNRVLSATVMKELRPRMMAAADAKVRELLEKRTFDGIADLAQAFPMSVFPDAVGLRPDGREHLLPYAGVAFNAFGPDNDLRRRALASVAPHVAWVSEQCQRENLAPGGLGAAVHAASDTGAITGDEATLLVRSLLTAGIDTTVNGIGAAIYCLARFPEQWRKLQQDSTLARAAFDEAIRFESPVQTFFRTTTRPATLGGVEIGEGHKVLMFLGAANRDPRKWQNPDSYDIARSTSGHVGFGSGVHMCVGALLARLEGEAIVGALARAVESIEITGPVKRAHNNTLRGLESLPLTVRAKAN